MLVLVICAFVAQTTAHVVSECGSVVPVALKQFVVQSPRYPHNYKSNERCEITLKSRDCPTRFHLQLLDIDLEWSSGCVKDRLEIGNQDVLCGTPTGVREYTSDGDLKLVFISDGEVSGKGYKLLITRYPCNLTKKIARIDAEELPNCCAQKYNSRRFYLASPSFPFGHKPTDCIYNIYRSNPNICRLRLHFTFFWSGINQQDCNNGFLQIDNKKICGCHNNLRMISEFDATWGDYPKVLRYKSLGYPDAMYSGFAVEIIQDECPLKTAGPNDSTHPKLYYYNDQLNRLQLPTTKKFDYMHYYCDGLEYSSANREETNYLDTSASLVPAGLNECCCRNFGYWIYKQLSSQVLWKKMQQCDSNHQVNGDCFQVKFLEGILKTPGYPFDYPKNLDDCYRFVKQPGFCKLNIEILDFDLESSRNCEMDYFMIDQIKYCGNCQGSVNFQFDLQTKNYEDVYFRTDYCLSGRGVKLSFKQTRCEVTTETPITTPAYCGGQIDKQVFRLTIPGNQYCEYTILKSSQDACGFSIDFLEFDLMCGVEFLEIDNVKYCVPLIGQSAFINYDLSNSILMRYKPRLNKPVSSNIVLRIQQSTDCEPPAQRILKLNTSLTKPLH